MIKPRLFGLVFSGACLLASLGMPALHAADEVVDLVVERSLRVRGERKPIPALEMALLVRDGKIVHGRAWHTFQPFLVHPVSVKESSVGEGKLAAQLTVTVLDSFPSFQGGTVDVDLELNRYGDRLLGRFLTTATVRKGKELNEEIQNALAAEKAMEVFSGGLVPASLGTGDGPLRPDPRETMPDRAQGRVRVATKVDRLLLDVPANSAVSPALVAAAGNRGIHADSPYRKGRDRAGNKMLLDPGVLSQRIAAADSYFESKGLQPWPDELVQCLLYLRRVAATGFGDTGVALSPEVEPLRKDLVAINARVEDAMGAPLFLRPISSAVKGDVLANSDPWRTGRISEDRKAGVWRFRSAEKPASVVVTLFGGKRHPAEFGHFMVKIAGYA